jgi:hypothetical protein
MGRVVIRELITYNMNFGQQRIENLVTRYDNRLNFGGDRVGKYWESSTTKSELFLIEMKMKKPEYTFYEIFSGRLPWYQI